MTDELIKLHTERTFIKKECDRSADNVRAALVTVASKMANASEIVSESDVLETLVEAYDLAGREEALSLIGMGPQFVKSAIGYSVDFNDAGAASVAYNADKETYDQYFGKIASKVAERKVNIDENKTM